MIKKKKKARTCCCRNSAGCLPSRRAHCKIARGAQCGLAVLWQDLGGVLAVEDRCFLFFSSRRRHTRLQGDWSSDVCSSDLIPFDEFDSERNYLSKVQRYP